jgi:hypothetical protein
VHRKVTMWDPEVERQTRTKRTRDIAWSIVFFAIIFYLLHVFLSPPVQADTSRHRQDVLLERMVRAQEEQAKSLKGILTELKRMNTRGVIAR